MIRTKRTLSDDQKRWLAEIRSGKVVLATGDEKGEHDRALHELWVAQPILVWRWVDRHAKVFAYGLKGKAQPSY